MFDDNGSGGNGGFRRIVVILLCRRRRLPSRFTHKSKDKTFARVVVHSPSFSFLCTECLLLLLRIFWQFRHVDFLLGINFFDGQTEEKEALRSSK